MPDAWGICRGLFRLGSLARRATPRGGPRSLSSAATHNAEPSSILKTSFLQRSARESKITKDFEKLQGDDCLSQTIRACKRCLF